MGQGIKTIVFPVKDLAGAKALFQDLRGVEPYADQKSMAVVRVHHYSVDEADYEEFLKRRAAAANGEIIDEQ